MNFIRQNVNPWLAMTLVALMAFWTVLYYVTNKAEAIGDAHVSERDAYLFDQK